MKCSLWQCFALCATVVSAVAADMRSEVNRDTDPWGDYFENKRGIAPYLRGNKNFHMLRVDEADATLSLLFHPRLAWCKPQHIVGYYEIEGEAGAMYQYAVALPSYTPLKDLPEEEPVPALVDCFDGYRLYPRKAEMNAAYHYDFPRLGDEPNGDAQLYTVRDLKAEVARGVSKLWQKKSPSKAKMTLRFFRDVTFQDVMIPDVKAVDLFIQKHLGAYRQDHSRAGPVTTLAAVAAGTTLLAAAGSGARYAYKRMKTVPASTAKSTKLYKKRAPLSHIVLPQSSSFERPVIAPLSNTTRPVMFLNATEKA